MKGADKVKAKAKAKAWLKRKYSAGDARAHRNILVEELYHKYLSADNEKHTLTTLELSRIIHKLFPSIRTANGPTKQTGKRESIYAGLMEKPSCQPLRDFNASTSRQIGEECISRGDTDSDDCNINSDNNDSDYIPPVPIKEVNTTDTNSLIRMLPPTLQHNSNFIELLSEQISQANKFRKTSRRWSVRTIQFSLAMMSASRQAYQNLKQHLNLPSVSHLLKYKNFVNQAPGFRQDNLLWMELEATRRKISNKGRHGCLIFDEMKVQTSLQLESSCPDARLQGFSEYGPAQILHQVRTGKEREVATHVLQLMFLGDYGFRFPVAYFATNEAVASELHLVVWQAIYELKRRGFTVNALLMDGSANNRAFMRMHFKPYNSTNCSYIAEDIDGQQVVMLMDPMHEFKKIRNSLIKSKDDGSGKRLLRYKSDHILWSHWRDAYNWDYSENNLKVYHKLTADHIDPDNSQLMRNHLALDVLNKEMLHLMKVYRNCSKRQDLEGTIDLLSQTSRLIENFTSRSPITSPTDERLQVNENILSWFVDWNENKIHPKAFISAQCFEDLNSMIRGTSSYVKMRVHQPLSPAICLHRLNSDIIENLFSSQRGVLNGCNTNPTLLEYGKNLNSIIISQNSISLKKNARRNSAAIGGAYPLNILTNQTFREGAASRIQ